MGVQVGDAEVAQVRLVPQVGHDLGGEQRMAAEVEEEVGLDGTNLVAETARPGRGDLALPAASAGGAPRRRRAAASRGPVGRGSRERSALWLGSIGHGVEALDVSRHHVRRQPEPQGRVQALPQFREVARSRAARRTPPTPRTPPSPDTSATMALATAASSSSTASISASSMR